MRASSANTSGQSFEGLNVADINVLQVDRFVRARDQLSPKTIGNLLTLLISMLNVAKDLGWIVAVPRIRKPQVRLCDADFAFLRTEDEVTRLLLAAQEEGEIVHALYATAIYTGMRKGELAALHWDDVDFERRLITVQRSFPDGPTKAGDVRHVPIVNALLPCLRAWRLQASGRLLFPSEVGSMRDPASRIFQETLHRVLNRAGFPRVLRAGKPRWYITFHGLRHTFASHWVMRSGELASGTNSRAHVSADDKCDTLTWRRGATKIGIASGERSGTGGTSWSSFNARGTMPLPRLLQSQRYSLRERAKAQTDEAPSCCRGNGQPCARKRKSNHNPKA